MTIQNFFMYTCGPDSLPCRVSEPPCTSYLCFIVVFLHVAMCECQWDTKFAYYGIPNGIRTIGAVPSCNGSSTGPQRTCVFGNTTCLSGRSFITAWSVSIARAKWCHLARYCPSGSIYYPIKSNWWILLIETSITRSLSVFYFFFGGGGDRGTISITWI